MFAHKLKKRVAQVKQQATEYIETIHAPEIIVKSRIEICDQCTELFKLTRNCKKCGCFVDMKARLKNIECPLKKW